MELKKILEGLNQLAKSQRLKALEDEVERIRSGGELPVASDEVNNHVHTLYSFSPYSPTAAAYMAWQAGLKAVGSVDHDSASGGLEMTEACKIIGMASTVGFELRVNMTGTKVEGKKTNNPDSHNISYIAIHGIPTNRIAEAEAFLEPIHEARNKRNVAQVEALNEILTSKGMSTIDFQKEVYEASRASEGGSITERHILAALSRKLIAENPDPSALLALLEEKLGMKLDGKIRSFIEDLENPHRMYDLLGILKSSFLPGFFIQPDEKECIPIKAAVDFALSIDAIPAYAYLGDVKESPTGDKKAEKFEDDYLDILIEDVKALGFLAVTYMPPRNDVSQLLRVQELCKKYDLMEISGVDINSSRQAFNCPEILMPEFRHLIDTTWALIANEKVCTQDPSKSIFQKAKSSTLEKAIADMAKVGANMDHRNPEAVLQLI